jgi:hypothetical protein
MRHTYMILKSYQKIPSLDSNEDRNGEIFKYSVSGNKLTFTILPLVSSIATQKV